MTNSLEHLAKLNTLIPFFGETFSADLELQYGGERKSLSGVNFVDASLVSVTVLSRELLLGLDVSLSVHNLFDEHDSNPDGAELRMPDVELAGRGFRFAPPAGSRTV